MGNLKAGAGPSPPMTSLDISLFEVLQKGLVNEVLSEQLLIESLRDLLKDEIKSQLQQKLKENPEIHTRLKEALSLYFEAKLRELYAGLKLAKASGELALETLPEKLQDSFSQEIMGLVEKELGLLLEKAL